MQSTNLEVLLLPPLLLRRRRALDGGALPDLPHRTCGSTIERLCVRPLFEGSHLDQDLFVGVTRGSRSVRGRVHLHASPTLHQLFRCKRSVNVERLQEGKLDQSILCLHLPRSVLGFGFRSAENFCFLLRIPTHLIILSI